MKDIDLSTFGMKKGSRFHSKMVSNVRSFQLVIEKILVKLFINNFVP